MTTNRLEQLAQMSEILTDSVEICDDLIKDVHEYNTVLQGLPHWEAIKLRQEELIRIYGSAKKVVAEAFEAEKQRQQKQQVEGVGNQEGCAVTAELTGFIEKLVREAAESGQSKNITLEIAVDKELAPTVH